MMTIAPNLSWLKALPLVVLFAFASGCDNKGPAEKAGESIDNAATDMGNAIEDKCEQAKESMGAKDTDC